MPTGVPEPAEGHVVDDVERKMPERKDRRISAWMRTRRGDDSDQRTSRHGGQDFETVAGVGRRAQPGRVAMPAGAAADGWRRSADRVLPLRQEDAHVGELLLGD